MVPRSTIAMIAVAVLLAGCAGLRPGWETPTVTVKSVRAVASQGMLPEFEIDLHMPVIEGYGEGDITLNASADLFAGVGLVREMMSGRKETLSYSFEAKLDPGALRPSIRVKDSGEVSLAGARSGTGGAR